MHEDQHGATDRLIQWTGERCVPWTGDYQVIYEHYHRYLLAAQLVDGLRVLDLASGEGYGAALLAERAEHVTGIEIDEATVAHSIATYPRPNLEFLAGSMLDLSRFDDGTFDVVTCFEALEHVVEHEVLLEGVKRVLKADGVFLTSTPDRLVYTEALHQHNPHHVRELSLAEFEELLGRYFPNVGVWGQAVAVGSLMRTVSGADVGRPEVLAIAPRDEDWVQLEDYPPTYYVGVASARALPIMPSQSVLVDTELTVVRSAQREAEGRSAAELAAARAKYEAQIANMLAERTAAREAYEAQIADMRAELTIVRERYEAQIAEMAAEQKKLADHLGLLDRQAQEAGVRDAEAAAEIARLRDVAVSLGHQVVEAQAERDEAVAARESRLLGRFRRREPGSGES